VELLKNEMALNNLSLFLSNQDKEQEEELSKSFEDIDEENSSNLSESDQDSPLLAKEETIEIQSPLSPARGFEKGKSKNSVSMNILSATLKEKVSKTLKSGDFEESFKEKINLRRKAILKGKTFIDVRDTNLFDFNFEQMKDYEKYYKLGNFGNTLKKFKIFLRNKEKKRRKNKYSSAHIMIEDQIR